MSISWYLDMMFWTESYFIITSSLHLSLNPFAPRIKFAMAPRLGLDVGDVMSVRYNDETLEPWQTVEPGVYPFCLIYAANYGPGALFAISRTNSGVKYNKKGKPLWAQSFFDEVGFADIGVPADNVRICTKHAEKGPIATELGLTHFVDNHTWCLSAIASEPSPPVLYHYDNSGRRFSPKYHENWFYGI